MQLVSPTLSVSASNIDTFEDCPARFYHERNSTDRIPTDDLAAKVGGAIHGALMEFHGEAKLLFQQGRLAMLTDPPARLQLYINRWLRTKWLDRMDPKVTRRIESLRSGLDLTANLIVNDMPRWATDPIRKQLLVWAEQRLDHGPAIPAVDFGPGYRVTTRPDVIGLRLKPAGDYRALVRDFKTRAEPVNPVVDIGALVRGIWVITELQDPRCPWFVVGRNLLLDRTGVDLETVNLACTGEQFLLRHSITESQLLGRRDEFREIIAEMGMIAGESTADHVLALPNGLCYEYCPFLHRCQPGQEHVRNNRGSGALAARLSAR